MCGYDDRSNVKEVSIMRQISHENLVTVIGVSFYEEQFHIAMELVDGDSLYTIIYRASVKEKY